MKILRYYLNGTLLEHSPEEWGDSLISRVRNEKYHGVSEKFTGTFTFIKEGASMLRELFYTDGFEALCTFEIEQINDRTLEWAKIFSGNIDFSTFVDDRLSVKVSISESSIWETIKANESTEFEIDIDSNNPITIEATFPYLHQSLKMLTEDNEGLFGDISVGLFEIENEFKVPALETYETPVANKDIPGELAAFAKVLVQNKNFTIHIEGELRVRVNSAPCTIGVYLFKYYPGLGWNSSWELAKIVDLAPSSSTTDMLVDLTINETIYADPEQAYGIGVLVTSSGGGDAITYIDRLLVEIDYLAQVPSAKIKAITPETLFQQLLLQLNDGVPIPYEPYGFFSYISDYLITSGDAIRGLPGSKIKTTFKDFFESLDAIFDIGLGVETIDNVKTIIISDKYKFYGSSEIANIGTVSDLEVSVLQDSIFSSLTVGYEEQTYDDVNGKFEPNQSQDWSFPIKKVANKAEQISKYRADIYGITFTSLKLEGKTTTDSSTDNDVFILQTTTPYGQPTILNRNFDVSSVSGFPDPAGLFNVELTPKRCLGRHLRVYSVFLRGQSLLDKYIKFQSAIKNAELGVRMNYESNPVFEKEDWLVQNAIGVELFLPYQFSFRTVVSREFNSLISSNMHGFITFSWMGHTYSGYIKEIGVNPQQNSEYTFKLISTPFNDLSKLIR